MEVFAHLVMALVFKTSGGLEESSQWVRFPYTSDFSSAVFDPIHVSPGRAVSLRAARMARNDDQGEGISIIGVYPAAESRMGTQNSSAAVPCALSRIYN